MPRKIIAEGRVKLMLWSDRGKVRGWRLGVGQRKADSSVVRTTSPAPAKLFPQQRQGR